MKLRRPWTIATAGLLTSVSAAAIYQCAASAEISRRITASLSGLPGASFGAVDVDAWSGRATVQDLSVKAGRVSVSAGRLAFRVPTWRLPSFVGPAYAAGGNATAENIVIGYPGGTVRLPRVEATGTSLSDADLASIFDPKSSAALTERVLKLSAEKISIPEATIDVKTPDLTEHVSYKGLLLEGAVKGKIGQFSSAGATFTFTGAKIPGAIEGSMGTMRGRDLDLLLYARFLGEARKSNDEPLQIVYRDVKIDGAEARGSDFAVKIGAITGDTFMARPLAMPLNAFVATMPAETGQKPTPERLRQTFAFVTDIYDSISFGTSDFRNVSATFGRGTKAGSLQIARFGIGDFAHARIGAVTIEGFRVSAPDALVGVKTFSLRGFDFKPGLNGLATFVKANENPSAVNPRSFIPTLDQILIAGVDADVRDKNHKGNAENGARDKFTLGKFEVNGSNYQLGIPATLSATLEHLALDLPEKDPSTKQLMQMGYKGIDVSSAFEYAWNEADSSLTLKKLSLSGEGIGGIALAALFGNVTKDLFVGDAAVAQAAALGANVKSAELRLDDAGFLPRLFEQVAREQGKTPEQIRQEAVTGVPAAMKQMFGDIPQATAISDAVVAFLKAPTSLVVTAKSSKGVSAADLPLLQNPPELLKRLDISAKANQ